MGQGAIPADLDAVTGATVQANFELKTARLNDGITNFNVRFEINQSWDYNSYYDSTNYESQRATLPWSTGPPSIRQARRSSTR